MEGIRCINPDCDLEEIEPIEITDYGYWSNATSWPEGEVPTGGDVTITSTMWIIYDLEDSPVFDLITVNGRLSFLDEPEILPDLNLNTHYIFVRGGELLIGSADEPYSANAKITLFGARADEQVVMSGTVEAGNKIIANTGLVEMYGTPRNRMTRLLSPVYRGYTETLVEQFMDWQAGDMLYFAPTNHNPYHHEYIEIEEYNS